MKTNPCQACNGTGKQIDHAAMGQQLRKARVAAKVSLRAFAERLGVSAPYLSDLEQGKRNWTTDKIKEYRAVIKAITA